MPYKIVKEVDRLGRIVLPKNIREHLKVKCGDSVCLEISNDNIIMSKNNKINNINSFGELICESIYEMSDCICLLLDNEKVVCASGISKGILGQQPVINNSEIRFCDKKISISEYFEKEIISNQKNIGKIIVAFKGKIDDKLKITVEIIARYIGKLTNG